MEIPTLIIQPPQGYAAMHINSTNRDVIPAVANTFSTFVVPHFGTNFRPK